MRDGVTDTQALRDRANAQPRAEGGKFAAVPKPAFTPEQEAYCLGLFEDLFASKFSLSDNAWHVLDENGDGIFSGNFISCIRASFVAAARDGEFADLIAKLVGAEVAKAHKPFWRRWFGRA